MGITKYFEEGRSDFEIYGEIIDGWEEFKRDIDYEAFLVKRKY